MPAAKEPAFVLNEETVVFLRRYEEARRYGFCKMDARMWADYGGDVGELRRLKREGCPARLAAKILRP